MSSYQKCLKKARNNKDLSLCPRGYCTAKHKFDVYPSAYANGYAVQVCKGTKPDFKGKQFNSYDSSQPEENSSLERWFSEKWIDVCDTLESGKIVPCGRKDLKKSKRDYPYCRPLYRLPGTTVTTAGELSNSQIRKMCHAKNRVESGKMGKFKDISRPPNRIYLSEILSNQRGGAKIMPNMELVSKYNRLKNRQKRVSYNGQMVTLYKPSPSNRSKKKLQVYVEDPQSDKIVNIHFGHTDYEDYTIHRNQERRENYCARSAGMCKKYGCDVTSANFWSRMVLWDCPV